MMSRMSAVCVCCPWSCKDYLPIQLYLLHLLQKVQKGFEKRKTTFLTWKTCCRNRCDAPRGSRFLSDCQNLCLHNGTSTSATCEGQTSKERPQQRRDGVLVRVLWLWLRKRSAHGAEWGVPGMSFCLRSFVVLSFPLFFFSWVCASLCSPSHFKTMDCTAVSYPAAELNTPSICATDPSWASTAHSIRYLGHGSKDAAIAFPSSSESVARVSTSHPRKPMSSYTLTSAKFPWPSRRSIPLTKKFFKVTVYVPSWISKTLSWKLVSRSKLWADC